MTAALTIECAVHFRRQRHGGRKHLRAGPEPPPPSQEPGRVPRIARLMALALRFDQLLRAGQIASYAELARLGQVTPARISQIMNLLCLAPDLQEALLFLPRVTRGRDPLHLRQLQPIAAALDWQHQRRLWRALYRPTPG
jgi:hypothetical protein